MASPQIDNGFTKIANELQEAFCKIRIPGEERQVLDVILRKTYGWNKKEDAISLSQFVLLTGINKPNVCRALSKLIMKNMIIKKDKGISVNYSIQKDYTRWKPLSKKIALSKKIMPVIKKDNKSSKIVIKKDTHKRKEYKDTITKEREMAIEFEEFWKFYYQMGNKADDPGDKPDAKRAYNILRVTASKAEIVKASNGYSGFLKHKELKEGFKQRKMYASTFLRSKKWKRFLAFEYKPPL